MKIKTIYLIMTAVIALNFVSCKKADLESEKGQYSYAIGFNTGERMIKDDADIDLKSYNAGLEDALKRKENRLTPEQINNAMKNFLMNIQKRRSETAGK